MTCVASISLVKGSFDMSLQPLTEQDCRSRGVDEDKI